MDIYYIYLFLSLIVLSFSFSHFYGFKKISKDIEVNINPFKNFSQPETNGDFFMPQPLLPDLDPDNALDQMKARFRLLPIKILVYTFTATAILLTSALIIAPVLTIITQKVLLYF